MLYREVESKIKEHSSQLEEKANEIEVIKKGEVDLDEMTERTLQAIQGGEGTNFSLLSIPRDGSVTPNKTNFINYEESLNLFNKDIVEVGFGAGAVGSDFSINTTNTDFRCYKFEVSVGDKYTVTGTSYYYQFIDDNNKVVLRGGDSSSNTPNVTIVIPENTRYLAVNFKNSIYNVDNYMIVKGTEMPESYIAYTKPTYYLDNSIKLAEDSVTLKNVNFATKIASKNLFNKEKVKTNLLVGNIGETIRESANSSFANILFPCEPNSNYIVSGTSYAYLLADKNYTILGKRGSFNSNDSNVIITTPPNCTFIGINFKPSVYPVDSYMIVKGTEMPLKYEPFFDYIKFDKEIYIDNPSEKILYVSTEGDDNNTGVSIGDSLATFQKAIDDGATTIIAKAGTYKGQYINAKNLNKLNIYVSDNNGNPKDKIILDNSDTLGDLTISDNIFTQAFTPPNSNWNDVFIEKTMEIKYDTNSSGIDIYNVNVWEINNDGSIINDSKLKPVLTLEECKATRKSVFYDGNNIYINTSDGTLTNKTYKYVLNEEVTPILIQECNDVVIENLKVLFGGFRNVFIEKCKNVKQISIESGYSSRSGGNGCNYTNATLENCISYKCMSDGMGGSNNGNTTYINCKSFYNYDDGISHHDGNTGTIIGGEYYGNKKAGVAPAHGAQFELQNIICHDNLYGFYCESADDREVGRSLRINGCLAYNNTYGLSYGNYHVTTFNCDFINNTTPTIAKRTNSTTSLTQY